MEPEPQLRWALEQALLSTGSTVLTARDGREAVLCARAHPGAIHLLLTEARLPDLRPEAIVEQLRGRGNAPAVLLTAWESATELRSEGLIGPGWRLTRKPIRLARFQEVLRDLLD